MKQIMVIIFLAFNCIGSFYAMQPFQWMRSADQKVVAEEATQELANIDYYDYEKVPLAKIEELLKDGADPNVITTKGMAVTPLVFALGRQRNDIVNAFLKAGANIDLAFRVLAQSISHFSITLSELVRMGADINQKYPNGLTALMIMASRAFGNSRMVNLLESGANPNLVDAAGNTALILAIQSHPLNRRSRIEILLTYHANPNIKNNAGKTAFDVARDKGLADILKILSEYKSQKIL